MLSLFDRISMERALSLPLDPVLRDLLASRLAHVTAGEFPLTELTQFLIVETTSTEADIFDEIGLSPLVNPIDGACYGSAEFQPWWDGLDDHGGWFEMIITVGNSGFAYIVLVEDCPSLDSDLLSLYREYAE